MQSCRDVGSLQTQDWSVRKGAFDFLPMFVGFESGFGNNQTAMLRAEVTAGVGTDQTENKASVRDWCLGAG